MEPSEENGAKKNERGLPDLIKRGLLAGIGALFMTEEGVRSILGELKLPKEAAQFVINQVAKTKEDLFNIIANEIRTFLETTNLAEEVRKVLSTTSLQISTTVRFNVDEESVRPDLKTDVKVKSDKPKKTKSKTKS